MDSRLARIPSKRLRPDDGPAPAFGWSDPGSSNGLSICPVLFGRQEGHGKAGGRAEAARRLERCGEDQCSRWRCSSVQCSTRGRPAPGPPPDARIPTTDVTTSHTPARARILLVLRCLVGRSDPRRQSGCFLFREQAIAHRVLGAGREGRRAAHEQGRRQPKCESALHYRPTHTETVPSSGSRPSGVIPSTALGRCWLSCDRKSLEPIPDWRAMFCTCVSPSTCCS